MPTAPASLQSRFVRDVHPWLSPDTDRTGLSGAGCAVLVVDDDRGVRRLTARMLRSQGYQVYEAASGQEALRALKDERSIQLVVTDIVMPEMHGLDLADRVLAAMPDLHVVLMTGHAPELTVQLELRDTQLPVLLKPFTAEQLFTKVRNALGGEQH